LWPRSRAELPKPFLPLVGERSLFEQTVDRSRDQELFNDPVLVTGSRLLNHVQDQLGDAANVRIVVEPEPKNTAPAVALAAFGLPGDAVMLVCPSDHHIGNLAAFKAAVRSAVGLAADGWLVCIGITPTRAEVGFGYLKTGEAIAGGFTVDQFVEKPDHARASQFVGSGDYFWNAGIFAFRADRFLQELETYRPAMFASIQAAWGARRETDACVHPGLAEFSKVAPESIDYAVMENAGRVAMVPADLDWSDIGNWQAVRNARPADALGNSRRGPAQLLDCRNVMVDSDGPRVHVLGMDDVIVVVDGNDVLVTRGDAASGVGKLAGAGTDSRA
jgi:mannose-1-phosphate guanylyltransferase/mannose-6-phosphate isomerase